MNLIRTSLLNGVAVLIKMIALLGINKVLAVYVGPAGYAAVGQFQNAVQMITTFASGAINTGVTKYTAEYESDSEKQRVVWRTAGTISVSASIFLSILILIFSEELALWFLKDASFAGVFVWFSLALVFFSLNSLLLAILNGKREIVRYVLANISGSLFSLIVTALLAMKLGLYGALVGLAIYQSLSFLATLIFCFRLTWFKFKFLFGKVDYATSANLAKYTLMALTSALCVPISHILVRNYLGENLSWVEAGYWEAMWRLSAAYLLLITTTLSVYFLPRLSAENNKAILKREVLSGLKLLVPLVILGGLVVFVLRDLIIALLFTEKFTPMRDLFFWQLVGDLFKTCGWLLAYIMLSKPLVKLYVITEIVFSLSFYLLTIFFLNVFGFEGVAIAHAVNYLIYLIVMYCFVFERYLGVSHVA
ncbi:O-antigen translocase [Pseudomonas synxantha]|uniref:O-antigen translocase n=1 Tax=Pseudomonas synxantha TaxID=47883 RepID=UPI002367A010|nr:O-antigen translocase [Pseudomonas synxantha]WDG44127.1 O-antigen translocase [Pseudomonas synxantha]